MSKNLIISSNELKRLKEIINQEGLDYIISLERVRDTKLSNLKSKREVKKAKLLQKAVEQEEGIILSAKKFREDLLKKQTYSEKKFKALLKALKVDYEFQKIFIVGKSFRIVDFYLPVQNIVIEIDGDYHLHKDQKKKDTNRTRQLISKGINKVYRFKNGEVENNQECLNRIQKIIEAH